MTTSYQGEGEDCYLFPFEHPPEDKEANTKFDLKVDLTYGGSSAVPFSEDPNNSPFGFVIMVSPGAIQVTLDSRDGSHSEAIDCFDSVTEGDHTVRMLCTNPSESFNCRKIHLGHGAPGTIIQMPDSCGPGKYAVAKTLSEAKARPCRTT
ncbi:hypothetical protein MCOR29_006649 [Pyricularia oryzae]|nr:hypothetical protein MCOR34_008552 [Pyricularia oryzae]KAI6316619.1 hypothetical protein MCOR29_006649 [Pyricularia oryzae]KAI6414061.1 hypothetical protein MCOR20_002407 [Pyricularia oryzae]KAI6476204.1 hypothetical protein MCOR18_007119 [Pyricularia oryzae]KAI6501463.1 hypothetical protein MCOR11_002096 [Pyricularia oryzae]